MGYEVMVIFLVGVFLVSIALGVPIAYSLGLASILYLVFTRGFGFAPDLIVVPMLQSVNSFMLLSVPIFFFVGRLMNESGLTDRLFYFIMSLVAQFRGGRAYVNVIDSMIFAGISGTATADAAGPGAIEYESMINQGYSKEFSAGCSLGSSLLGPIIPPSIPALMYASMTEISATALLMAGLLPGILIGFVQMGLCAYLCRKRRKGTRATVREMVTAFRHSFLVMLTPVILIVGMGAGFFTATEAAAIAGFYLFVLAWAVYRTVTLKQVWGISREVVKDTAVVMFLLAVASFYGWLLTRLQIPQIILKGMISITDNPYGVVFIMIAFLLIMGCFFSTGVGLVIVAPIVAPIGVQLGFDPLHFGIIVLISMVMGSASPPVGASLYAIMQVTGLSMDKVWKGVSPFYWVTVAALCAMVFFPRVATFVPRVLMAP